MKLFINILFYTLLFSLVFTQTALSQDLKPKKAPNGYWYYEFLPKNYNKGNNPLLIFLHGGGEVGKNKSDLHKVKKHGPPREINNGHDMCFNVNGVEECFVVISPQTEITGWWKPEEFFPFLDFILSKYKIDESRVYLTGLSMGGYGSWWMAYNDKNKENYFAAIAPIAGRGNVEEACKVAKRNIPVWAFHGTKDKNVPVSGSRDMIEAIKTEGGNTRYTEFPDKGHNIWEEVKATPDLLDWLFAQEQDSLK